ncbi:MAG: cytochrome c oxidase subunit I [Halobacteriovoraceae bacterium]|nr:cytochrome c oxidase subunit I [Halobacteriovoraceae bacterium]|tara:strand:- start:5098 stop:6696 length:1599 start_codon:yes stop_codon:yes gene_type:complete
MSATDHAHHGGNYINCEKGLWSWLTTIDHKRIALMYFIAIMAFFLIGGLFAVLLRLELFTPEPLFMDGDTYNRAMTFHGAIMVFMVIVPGVPALLGNFALPLMIGAKDVAFPKLNLASWYLLMIGAAIAVASLFFGGVDTGWTFYTPYSGKSAGAVTMVVLGAFIMGFSSIATGINFIVTIHTLRCKGMTMMRLPLFVWALYSTAIIQVIATPVLGITLLLLVFERTFGIGIFDPALGGDPVLFQHFFWFYSHPAVYIMIIPPMGIISEVIATFSQKTIFGYKAIAFSSLAIAAVSFLVWGHHMFVSGQSGLAGGIFSILTMLVGVPTAIKLFNWTATMYKGQVKLDTPMLYAINFLSLFTIGGLTGLFCAAFSIDVHIHDTYFVVAHFHYVMLGGAMMGFFAGLFYWFPKMSGKMYNEPLGRVSAIMTFVGTNLTFLPQFVMGSMGMPRRYHTYDGIFTPYHVTSTIGSWIVASGFLLAVFLLAKAFFNGKKCTEKNPWGATTLEWTVDSPPIHENFTTAPEVHGRPYEYR